MRLAVALVLALVVAPARGAPEQFTLDPVHCQVLFFVSHLGFSTQVGRFPGVSGTFRFDRDDWSGATAEATIEVSSLYLGDDAWEKKILSDDFLDVERHPRITFRSERIEPVDDKRARVTGALTLHGVTRPVTLDVRLNRIGRHSFSLKHAAGFSATAKLRRSEFGMRRLLPAVGDEIEIRLEIEGLRTKRSAAGEASG